MIATKFYRLIPALMLVAMLIADSNPANGQMSIERVASGLSSPVFVTYAPGDAERLFIVERGGRIRILNLTTGNLNAQPFVTIPGLISGGERGLLGLAFHPDYQNNGLFYVNYTDNTGGDTQIRQFSRLTADTADASSGVRVIEFNQPQSNHNGGWTSFGPDGFLYVATGDGGGANDTGSGHTAGTGNAQDITDNLLGKMLRIDINGDDFPSDATRNYAIPPSNPFVGVTGDDEIFAYGLRNPWRCSFDRETGDLWMGDVGQNAIEEITMMPAGSAGGQNYGWRNREGNSGAQPPGGSIDPVYAYLQGGGSGRGFSVTGGYVYRGPIEALQGYYFFSDYITSQLWSIRFDGTANEADFDGNNFTNFVNWNGRFSTTVGNVNNPSSFGEDLEGNIYIVDLGGEVFRINSVEKQVVESFEVTTGTLLSGDVDSLNVSDNDKLTMRGIVNPVCRVVVKGTAPGPTPVHFAFTSEVSTRSARPGVEQVIELFNYQTNDWELLDVQPARVLGDKRVTVNGTGDLSRFVQAGTNEVQTRISLRRAGLTRLLQGFVDHAEWTIVD